MDRLHYLLNVTVISESALLEHHAVVLKNDRIFSILPMENIVEADIRRLGAIIHEGRGQYVSPGFIDIHSDNIETVVQPRPTSVMDFGIALMEHEKQLVNEGITTMYHSLSFLRNEGSTVREKEVRRPDRMQELAELIKSHVDREHLIRHRFHCRYDIRNVEGYDTMMAYMSKDYIHLLSFIDHTPGQGQYRDLDRYRLNLKAHKPDMADAHIDRLIAERMAVPKLSPHKIARTALMARSKGIPIASHDDDSLEKLDYVRSELKADISEFPVELAVARRAREKGMLTVAGAPNVLMGHSHSGNLSATEAILDGSVDILCSDYYPSSLLHAVFILHGVHGVPLFDSMKLVTLNPAKALGIEDAFGSVAVGKKADLLLIGLVNGKPAISKVFIDGELVSELNYRRAANA